MSWSRGVEIWLDEGLFERVSAWYEHKIQADLSQNVEDYFHLGLSYLLEGREEDAQATWFLGLSQVDDSGLILLAEILNEEARRQTSLSQLEMGWLIRSYIREIYPEDINNILSLWKLEIELNTFNSDKLAEVEEIFLTRAEEEIDQEILQAFLTVLFSLNDAIIVDIVKLILNKYTDDIFIKIVANNIENVAQKYPLNAADIVEFCLSINSTSPYIIYLAKQLPWYYIALKKYSEARESVYKFYRLCENLPEKAFAAQAVIMVLMNCGYWLELEKVSEEYNQVLINFLESGECPRFSQTYFLAGSHLVYLKDDLAGNRWFYNLNGKLYQRCIELKYKEASLKRENSRQHNRKIKIGYIGHTLRNHSIGIITRWLFKYHDREEFDINLYLVNQAEDSITRNFFRSNAHNCYNLPKSAVMIAEKIKADEIDILIDVDCLTGDTTSEVMALKPAPVQVSWLGWDASGMPAIDYYIADNYVLPENSQEYYSETIWRLPNCYMAIDGVEVDTPTLRRQDLGIGPESTVYLTAQTGSKRHPDTIRLQMQVLKSVPDSYLLVQGKGAESVIEQLFLQIASSEGVNWERLRFLPSYLTLTYRANLAIADVVLDTYPFTGGTTTLDILWMGIPLVTKVGQQWASRNSYTLMVNAGLNEGIAWNDDEYIEWGIRLGTDSKLRENIRWKLRRSRQTAPIWNTKQFAKDIESAYRQMWEIYQGQI